MTQYFRTWASPPHAIAKPSPNTRVDMPSRSLAGPARWTRKVNSKMPSAPASSRRGSCAFVMALDTGHALRNLFVVEVPTKDAFGVRQCFGCVHVLPVSLADLQGTQAPLAG